MKKTTLTLVLTLVLLATFSTVAMASPLQATVERLNPNNPEVKEAIDTNFNYIYAYTDNGEPDGNFAGLTWIAQSMYASQQKTIKYQTQLFTFRIGEYSALLPADSFRSIARPGEVIYDRVTITREALANAFGNVKDEKEKIEAALDCESHVHIGAIINIYNDKNGNGRIDPGENMAQIVNKNEINSKASMFPAKNREDMRSRYQSIALPGRKAPDFYPTPEGATVWTESFANCAKTYTGEPGETIDIPVRLYNGGKSTSKTDFQASWYGSGWQNPVWNAGDVELSPGE